MAKDENESTDDNRQPGLIARIKKFYREKPVPFALSLLGLSVLALVVGIYMVGDANAGVTMAPAPFSP